VGMGRGRGRQVGGWGAGEKRKGTGKTRGREKEGASWKAKAGGKEQESWKAETGKSWGLVGQRRMGKEPRGRQKVRDWLSWKVMAQVAS
jgi:hypothetical protein